MSKCYVQHYISTLCVEVSFVPTLALWFCWLWCHLSIGGLGAWPPDSFKIVFWPFHICHYRQNFISCKIVLGISMHSVRVDDCSISIRDCSIRVLRFFVLKWDGKGVTCPLRIRPWPGRGHRANQTARGYYTLAWSTYIQVQNKHTGIRIQQSLASIMLPTSIFEISVYLRAFS